jgi:hypothetical protein
MIEPVSARSTTKLQEVYDRFAQHREQGAGEVAPGDQQRFEAALKGAPQAPDQAREIQVAQVQTGDPWVMQRPAPAGQAAPAVPTIGERILDGMGSLRDGWHSMGESLREVAAKPNITIADALNLQIQMSQTTAMMQIVSQEVGTVSQKLDGLLKTG